MGYPRANRAMSMMASDHREVNWQEPILVGEAGSSAVKFQVNSSEVCGAMAGSDHFFSIPEGKSSHLKIETLKKNFF